MCPPSTTTAIRMPHDPFSAADIDRRKRLQKGLAAIPQRARELAQLCARHEGAPTRPGDRVNILRIKGVAATAAVTAEEIQRRVARHYNGEGEPDADFETEIERLNASLEAEEARAAAIVAAVARQ